MGNYNLSAVLALAEAFDALSDNKKEYLLGFAEGVIAARGPEDDQGQDKADKETA